VTHSPNAYPKTLVPILWHQITHNAGTRFSGTKMDKRLLDSFYIIFIQHKRWNEGNLARNTVGSIRSQEKSLLMGRTRNILIRFFLVLVSNTCYMLQMKAVRNKTLSSNRAKEIDGSSGEHCLVHFPHTRELLGDCS
jgi:hypothetical protein